MMSYAKWGNLLYAGKISYPIIAKRNIFLSVGLILIIASIGVTALMGINPSIEFKGGTQLTVSNTVDNPPQQPAYDVLKEFGVTQGVRVFQVGSNGIRVQTEQLDSNIENQVEKKLVEAYHSDKSKAQATVSKESIGPSWGADVSRQALKGLITFLILVALVMVIYFRTWTMAASALFALSHDFFITIGIYALTQVEVTPATVIGFLTILGYSLYDTVVVFDRIRENTANMFDQSRVKYAEYVNLSVNQTMVRSINTSVIALLPVSAILFLGSFLLGAGTLRDISMPLFIGMIVGTCSSVLIASPMLVFLRQHTQKIKDHDAKVDKYRASLSSVAEGKDAERELVGVQASPLTPGSHQGQSAQPKRKKSKSK